jgi:hypothetical protein
MTGNMCDPLSGRVPCRDPDVRYLSGVTHRRFLEFFMETTPDRGFEICCLPGVWGGSENDRSGLGGTGPVPVDSPVESSSSFSENVGEPTTMY